jgi:tetratricopeptide (TPR) repeat protein/predicted Ser/Thr protein kinase
MGEERSLALAETDPAGTKRSSSRPPNAELTPGTHFGRYVVLKTLGQGGMGIVYMAYDAELDRRVALKLVLYGEGGAGRASDAESGGAHRLLREAQALARLSHPNVVAVFDAGSLDGRVFLAMEYLDGATLRAWRSAAPRTVREIVATYVQAARGLEAAHREGILHRDFKPDNAVIDSRGRVRVLDFGLARVEAQIVSYPELAVADTEVMKTPAMPLPSGPLTRVGDLLGTPAYMSPEQLRGQRIDARTDQFAFAVALHEALYGTRPFDGRTLKELREAVEAGRLSPPPKGTNVPRAVRAVIARGLRPKKDDRFASMTELLAALERAMQRRWPVAAAAVAVLAGVAVAAAAALARPARAPVCRSGDSEVAGVWGADARAKVATAFEATGNPRAKEAASLAAPVLDDYAARWASMRDESCQATRVRGVQSDEALDLRTACLDQRFAELRATVAALESADAKLVDHAVDAARAVSDIGVCADVAALRAPYAQPHDAATRAKVVALREQLARATALVHAQKLDDAAAEAEGAALDADAIGNRAVYADARLQQAYAEGALGRSEEAQLHAHDAALAADVSRDDATEASAWTELVYLVGTRDGRLEDADEWAALAQAAITRAGGSPALGSELARRHADTLYSRGKYKESAHLYEEAFALARRAWGDGSPEAAGREIDVADVQSDDGDLAGAVAHLESAIARQAAAYGESPLLGHSLYSLAFNLLRAGDADGALAAAERLLHIGPAGTLRIHAQFTAARARIARGDTAVGRADADLAIAAYEATFGADDWHAGSARSQLAETLLARHLSAEADAVAARAIRILAASKNDPGALEVARLVRTIAAARAPGGKPDVAAAEAMLSAEDADAATLPHELLLPLLAVGEAELATGRADRATATLERAADIAEKAQGYPVVHADVHLALAHALLASHGDEPRARDLAARAAREYDALSLAEPAAAARALGSPATPPPR